MPKKKEKPASPKWWVFWPYDLFPYWLGAPIETETDTSFSPKGYGGALWVKKDTPHMILAGVPGAALHQRLREIESDYQAARMAMNTRFKDYVESAMEDAKIWRGPQHG